MGYLDFYNLNDSEKQEVFNSVSFSTGLPAFAVEKDWWVVRTLDVIFQSHIASHTVFKGGTSLSKAWKLVSRFSEDIDLALDKGFLGFDVALTRKKEVKRLRRASFKFISERFLPELQNQFRANGLEVEVRRAEVSSSDQDPLIIEIYYQNVVETTKYIEARVLVELGSRSLREPFSIRPIRSVIGEAFSDASFADKIIHIPSVNPERTFLEKLFLLHEEFQRPNEKIRIDRLSRHLYDIDQIAQTNFASLALKDIELYRSIVEHRQVYTYLSGIDYKSHYPPNLNPVPPKALLKAWEKDYVTMQKEMIYGYSLPFEKLIEKITQLTSHINSLKFNQPK